MVLKPNSSSKANNVQHWLSPLSTEVHGLGIFLMVRLSLSLLALASSL